VSRLGLFYISAVICIFVWCNCRV